MITLADIDVQIFGSLKPDEESGIINYFWDVILSDLACDFRYNGKHYDSYSDLADGMRRNLYVAYTNNPYNNPAQDTKIIINQTGQRNNKAIIVEDLYKNAGKICAGWREYIYKYSSFAYETINSRINNMVDKNGKRLIDDEIEDVFKRIDELCVNSAEVKLTYLTFFMLLKDVFLESKKANKTDVAFPFSSWEYVSLFSEHDISSDSLKVIGDLQFKGINIVEEIKERLNASSDGKIILFGNRGMGLDTFARKVFEKERDKYDVVIRMQQKTAFDTLQDMIEDSFQEHFNEYYIKEVSSDFLKDQEVSKLIVIHRFNTYDEVDLKYIDSWKNCKVIITTSSKPKMKYDVYKVPELQLEDLRDIFWDRTEFVRNHTDEEATNDYIDKMVKAVHFNVHLIKKIAESCTDGIEDYYNKHFKGNKNLDRDLAAYIWKLFDFEGSSEIDRKTLLELIAVNDRVILDDNNWKLFFTRYSKVDSFVSKRFVVKNKADGGYSFTVDPLLLEMGKGYSKLNALQGNLWGKFYKKLNNQSFVYSNEYLKVLDVIFRDKYFPASLKNECYANVCFRMGRDFMESTKTINAVFYYKEALEVYKKLKKNNKAILEKYYDAMDALGYIYSFSRTTFSRSEEHLEKAVVGRTKLYNSTPSENNKSKLASSLDHLGYVLSKHDFSGSLERLIAAVSYRLDLANADSAKYIVNLAWSLDNIGYILSCADRIIDIQLEDISSLAKRVLDFCEYIYINKKEYLSNLFGGLAHKILFEDIKTAYVMGRNDNYSRFFLFVALLFRNDANQAAFTLNNMGISQLGETRSIRYMRSGLKKITSENIDGKAVLYNNLAVSMMMSEFSFIHYFQRLLFLFTDSFDGDPVVEEVLNSCYSVLDMNFEFVCNALHTLWERFLQEEWRRKGKDFEADIRMENCLSAFTNCINDLCGFCTAENATIDKSLYKLTTDTKNELTGSFFGSLHRDILGTTHDLIGALVGNASVNKRARQICDEASAEYFFEEAIDQYTLMNEWNDDSYLAEYYSVINNYAVFNVMRGAYEEANRLFSKALDGYIDLSSQNKKIYKEDIGDIYYNMSETNRLYAIVSMGQTIKSWSGYRDLSSGKAYIIDKKRRRNNHFEFIKGTKLIAYTLSGCRNHTIFVNKDFALDI